MKKILLFHIFNLILVSSINSQHSTFSKFYNIFDGNEGTFRFLMCEDRYFLCSMGICDPGSGNSKLGTSFFVLDNELNIRQANCNTVANRDDQDNIAQIPYYFGSNLIDRVLING